MASAGTGYTVWLTGLSASGKTTISEHLAGMLRERIGLSVQVIDGDLMRRTINRDLGYTQRERNIASERMAYVARLLNDNGVVCVVSNISQDRAIRAKVRQIVGNFLLVFVDAPADVCAGRDKKGHYEKAFAGAIEHFVGVTDEYERPEDAEIRIDAVSTEPKRAAAIIMTYLAEHGMLAQTGQVTPDP